MIDLYADNKLIKVDWVTFSDGAITCKVDPTITECKKHICFTVKPCTPVSLVWECLILLDSALYELGENYRWAYLSGLSRYLNLSYLPYARGDRVFEQGNPLPLHEFMLRIDGFGFDKIYLCDVHNFDFIATGGYHTQIEHKEQHVCFMETMYSKDYEYVVAPDKGSVEKATKLAEILECKVLKAAKKRDIQTGKITEIGFTSNIPSNSKVIIVDDILDGGGTFIPLAQQLKERSNSIDLYCTHFIASKGLDLFKGLIDNLFYYHIVGKYVTKEDIDRFNKGE